MDDGQRRVRRQKPGSQAWQKALQAEVEARVLVWMTACNDIESMLMQDLKQVCL